MPAFTCAGCGTTFATTSPRARWCSEKCRKRAQRRGGSVPSAKLKAAPAPPPSELGPVETACAAELERAGRTRTVPGQIALLLARRLDAGTADTGSSVAAVAKQLAVVMETATRGAEQNDNPLHRIRQQMRDRAAAEGRPDPYPNGVSVI